MTGKLIGWTLYFVKIKLVFWRRWADETYSGRVLSTPLLSADRQGRIVPRIRSKRLPLN